MTRTRTWVAAAIGLGALALGACSGGGGSPTPRAMPTQAARAPSTAQTAQAVITLSIPPKGPASAQRRRHYVSPSTESVQIVANSTTFVEDAVPGTSACPTPAAGASLVCTFTIGVAVGQTTFAATTYDAARATGNVLSTTGAAGASVNIQIDQVNTVDLVLNAEVASIVLGYAPVPGCTATADAIKVTALDADANVIPATASGVFANPITLADSDSGANAPTSLTTSSIAKAGQSGMLSYNGTTLPHTVITAKTSDNAATASIVFAPVPTICSEFAIPLSQVQGTASTGPGARGIVTGPDNYLYEANFSNGTLGRVTSTLGTGGTPTGTIVPVPVTGAVDDPVLMPKLNEITVGPDGNLWITDDANGIESVSPSNPTTQSNFTQDGSNGQGGEEPEGITNGPSGNGLLWFANSNANEIVTLSTAGAFTIYPLVSPAPTPTAIPSTVPSPGPSSTATAGPNPAPKDLVAGPDGNMWYTEYLGDKIGVISTAGKVLHEYATPTSMSEPYYIAVGSDKALWFTEFAVQQIGRVDPATGTVTEFPISGHSVPIEIVTGVDGNLYFTDTGNDAIGRITPAGVVTEYPITTKASAPFGITVGPDNNLWFTESSGGNVGYVVY